VVQTDPEETSMNASRTTTRRELISRAAVAGTAIVVLPDWIAGLTQATPALAASRLTPELTEGPYWVDTMLRRSDVRANTPGAKTAPGVAQDGVPLELTINVLEGGEPLSGVAVDIWHANAHGLYSDESSQAAGGGTSGGDTSGENYLRGYQITGKDRGIKAAPVAGQVSFKTIWPGWYTGRAIHIHVRVRKLSEHGATIAGYTTQIFFSDADNEAVLSGAAPYNARSPQSDPTTDENDTVLRSADIATNVVAVAGNLSDGFTATFTIDLNNAEVAASGSLGRPNADGPPTGP
jgi:protocatechuate 3,4-dioxygenase beta subunit